MRKSTSVNLRKNYCAMHLWITDPWETLDHPRDTTLRLIEEASHLKKNIIQYWCNVKSIRLEPQYSYPRSRKAIHRVLMDTKRIISVQPDRYSNSFEFGPLEILTPQDFNFIYYRTDPPVDLAYLHPLHLLELELGPSKKTHLINPLDVLLKKNEKMEATGLSDLMPLSIVSSQREYLLKFGKSCGKTVLKPLHEAQSHGVELLDWRSPTKIKEALAKLSKATNSFQTPIILQTFLEGILKGETRLWFLNGNLLAHVKKVPKFNDFRIDMDQGSRLAIARLTSAEKKSVLRISEYLCSQKICLAAVDLIENKITDFNFTSPGLIPLMESLLNKNLARPIVEALFF